MAWHGSVPVVAGERRDVSMELIHPEMERMEREDDHEQRARVVEEVLHRVHCLYSTVYMRDKQTSKGHIVSDHSD